MFSVVAAALLAGLSLSGDASYFDASANPVAGQAIHVEGLTNTAWGTIYPGGALEDGGMPLGGVGTGYLCFDTDGRIGKASIFNRYPQPMVIGQPFLTLTVGGRAFTLATPKNGVGDAKAVHYFGHFPMADARFELDAPMDVDLRAYSPFLPGCAVESNTPAALFEIALTNRSDAVQHATLTFSPQGFPKGEAAPFDAGAWKGVEVTHAPVEKLPDWVRHTYAIAVDGADGADGIDAADGADGADASVSASREVPPRQHASVSASQDVAPRQRATVRFLLTWQQTYLREGSNRVEKHMYAERFADAKAVTAYAGTRATDWRRRILAWQDAIYGADLPGWLKEALVNAPYALTKNSLWLAATRPDDWWGKEGLFLVNESFSTCSVSETMPCRFFGHWPALFFYPELELSTLKAIRYFQLRGGEPPFCMGLGFAIRDPRYHCQHTAGAGEYAQMIYRYYLRTGDKAFLAEFWDSARGAIDFMLSLDKDGDGLVEDHPHAFKGESFPANNPLDNWPWHGASSYTAGKGIAALMCGIKMAELVGDSAQRDRWQAVLEKARKSYEEKLWTGGYYRTYNDTSAGLRNDSCFGAQLSSVWCTRVLGLDDPLPSDRIETALDAIAKLNLPASPYGMVDAVFPDGTWCEEGAGSGIPDTQWSRDIFIQCNATAAMAFLYHGRRAEGERAARTMLDTIFRGPHAMPWAQPCGLSSKTGGTCHGHDYYDHMVVWSYPLAFAGTDIAGGCAQGSLVHKIIAAAEK